MYHDSSVSDCAHLAHLRFAQVKLWLVRAKEKRVFLLLCAHLALTLQTK